MPEHSGLPIFERWADCHDQSMRTDKGIFANYDLVLIGVVCFAKLKPVSALIDKLPRPF